MIHANCFDDIKLRLTLVFKERSADFNLNLNRIK